ncbi:16S rRNA (cytidine(1402)-2'-O)-methyltransferase [Lawsonia intracellularis]|uniref:Ribosomal RNA small subunit methyltransferase I n=1 Tax=Lawsonia intracellularis (strain PHE/MN1-00) TaxID=363253 RepID=Q1MRU6_LAWIP|nr:16S rRNA (cytidine(1402)-2'-O)-methyltransferase [Lawsonia intracellularis]AGC49630.1 tetrapyrrole methylase [Lawsonia intracellularis N343]KAA0205136.1 16S rRNA (cytidine(1402)-2'-O)-methyltransferase [Lawsonia intracellularis]MBZ3892336.1 16S rRNA (cytidine(1402)-2'-O)-methyltransferase [Lawsonia intracellularis]OMQ05965.1 rRNA (cytidine-2'-O-)-methyltransferase [Lawsonia intracellularis]RBN32317.1 16S rRNA (cytidine(1402)-2'-O)-methyltransferase [Lawsonia intracellularis]
MSLNSTKLWIVATPLGNPGDLSIRAKSVLESVDIVLAEDTRRAGLLCQHCNIVVKKFLSFHDHNEEKKLKPLLTMLSSGKTLALISDAGMPIISDPGYCLVNACRKASIPVSVVPGPSAPITALVGSGIIPHPFTFLGFLPRDFIEQEKIFSSFIMLSHTLVFFERKNRLINTLKNAYTVLGNREVCIARELTKLHEEFLFFNLGEEVTFKNLLGELTVIISPPKEKHITEHSILYKIITEEKKYGGTAREVAKRVQTRTMGWTTKQIYSIITSRS